MNLTTVFLFLLPFHFYVIAVIYVKKENTFLNFFEIVNYLSKKKTGK